MLYSSIKAIKGVPMKNKNFNLNNDNPNLNWLPMSFYNYPFKIKKLRIQNEDFYYFKPTIYALLIPLLCFIFFVSLIPYISKTLDSVNIGIFAITLPFLAIGFWFLYKDLKPIVFSKKSNLFWIGYKKPSFVNDINISCKLEDILAIQVLWKEIKYQFYHGFAYEINIVLKDNSRIHLFSVSDPKPFLEEASTLAKFLNVPLYYRT